MKRKFNKKLSLNKKTIAELNERAMIQVKGEGDWRRDWTGDCLSWIGFTCPDCDFPSVPLDECEIRFTRRPWVCPTGPCPPIP